jgi:hypothetical protein
VGEAKEGRVFLFLVVSPGGWRVEGGLSFCLWGDICVSVFFVLVFGLLGYLLSEIGRRDVLEVCEREREREGGPGLWFFVSQRWEKRTSRVSVYGK